MWIHSAYDRLNDMKRVGLGMLRNDERGSVNPLLIATVLLAVLLVAATGGFVWAYMQMTDWKNNTNAKIDVAVKAGKEQQSKDDDAKYAEEAKNPYLTFQGSADLGSVRFSYPKTWARYDAQTTNGSLMLYFNPVAVPVVSDANNYSLRVQVTSDNYSDVINGYQGLVQEGKATANTIVIGKTDSSAGYSGIRVDGQLTDKINGSVVIFKVRDKTLRLYVDSQDYINDFNNIILNSLKFQP